MRSQIKFFLLVMSLLLLTIAAASCGPTQTTTTTTTAKALTTDQVIDAFKKAGIPIGNVITYTAETDPNKLLGRPGQYTGKANWADTRVEQTDPQNPIGGTVEVFANKQDLEARKQYLKPFIENGAFAQYMYEHGLELVRIDHQLTPDQAEQYKKALDTLP